MPRKHQHHIRNHFHNCGTNTTPECINKGVESLTETQGTLPFDLWKQAHMSKNIPNDNVIS